MLTLSWFEPFALSNLLIATVLRKLGKLGVDRVLESAIDYSRSWTRVHRRPMWVRGLWTELNWSGSWTAVDQSKTLYRGLWSRTCLTPPNFSIPGKP